MRYLAKIYYEIEFTLTYIILDTLLMLFDRKETDDDL